LPCSAEAAEHSAWHRRPGYGLLMNAGLCGSSQVARTRDVVVVGGGHNGLACAAYLAKAGLDVLVPLPDAAGSGSFRAWKRS
jgi:NADPH-dependent 2,4-dienoyl-CoA reductase/sulfur reductase-like enzyme